MPEPRSSTVDLLKLTKGLDVSISSPEPDDVRAARLRREDADAEFARYQDKLILWAVLVALGTVFPVCVLVLALSDNPEKTKWATTLLTTIVAGGVGYMTGKRSRS